MQILGVPFLRSRHLPRLILWCGSILIIGMVALFGGAIVWLHQQALRDAESRLSQLNLVLTEQAERSLQSVDTVLQTIVAVGARGNLFDPAISPRMQTYLANQVEASPHVRSFLVMNRDGDLIIDSSNPIARSYNGADR